MIQPAVILRKASLLLLLLMYSTDAKLDIITRNTDIVVGGEILLLCKAGGEGDITWQKDDEEIEEEEKVTKVDETSSKLHIEKATMADMGKYTCLCDYDSGHSDSTSMQLFVYEGPSFGQTTTYHEFLEGTDGMLPCLVTGEPAVDVQWFRDNKAVLTSETSHVRQLDDNNLLITKVKRGDAGTYVCQAQIRGRPVYQHLPVSVVINAPPTVHLREEEKKVLAGPENNVTLLCLVDGLPPPNITWSLPTTIDPSRHHFNSDRSQLTIKSVTRGDYGEYVCTASNKISEKTATIMLHVFEAPEVSLSAEQQSVSVGETVSVSCNVSGHPQPQLYWLNKQNGRTVDSTSGRIRVVDGTLVIEDMMPSDGGLYSCMAVSTSGNASRDVMIHTQPGPPHYLSVSPGPSSVLFSLKTPPVSGGTPITGFALEWRESTADTWKRVTVPDADPLAITNLTQYTVYMVRLAALNAVGVGHFSEPNTVRTMGMHGEPDRPVLSDNEKKIEQNSFYIPLRKSDDGASPVQHFTIRYRQVKAPLSQDKDRAEWKDLQLLSDSDSITLKELSFGTSYLLEVTAVNGNGSSVPTKFNFTIGDQPVSRSITKGSVIGIVMVLFLVVFLVVDATCCYKNHCGLLMSIAVKVFGYKVPGLKMLDDGEAAANGGVKLKGLSTPRGSLTVGQTKEGQLTEVTCDKASLTKHEKTQPGRELPNANV